MENNYFENEYIKFWFEGPLLVGEYKKSLNIDVETAKKIVASRVEFCKGKDFAHVLTITGINGTSREARDYFSKGDGIKHMKSLALLTDSPLSRTIGNFFLILNKPKVATKLFTDKKEAEDWSKDFI